MTRSFNRLLTRFWIEFSFFGKLVESATIFGVKDCRKDVLNPYEVFMSL